MVQGEYAMRATTEVLLRLLRKFVGAEVDLISEEVQADGRVLVNWVQHLPPGVRRLGPDPSVLVSADGETLEWDYSRVPFTLEDLAEADPANEDNRHPTTKELARRLEQYLRAANLMSRSGSAAFVVELRRHGVWTTSAAALVASATGQDYWELFRHAQFAWHYPRSNRPGTLPPPYSEEEMVAAQSVFAEEWFEKTLREKACVIDNALVLPVVSNVRLGRQVISR
jgi:hypothetical protein